MSSGEEEANPNKIYFSIFTCHSEILLLNRPTIFSFLWVGSISISRSCASLPSRFVKHEEIMKIRHHELDCSDLDLLLKGTARIDPPFRNLASFFNQKA